MTSGNVLFVQVIHINVYFVLWYMKILFYVLYPTNTYAIEVTMFIYSVSDIFGYY